MQCFIKIYEITTDRGETYFKVMTDRQKKKFKTTKAGKATLAIRMFQKIKVNLKCI